MGLSYIWFSQINRGIFPSCVHLSNIQVSYWAVSYLIIEHFNVICQHRGLWVKVPPFSTLYFAISDWFSSSSDDKPSWCPTMSFISRARLLRDLKSKIPFNLHLCWGVWQNSDQVSSFMSSLFLPASFPLSCPSLFLDSFGWSQVYICSTWKFDH